MADDFDPLLYNMEDEDYQVTDIADGQNRIINELIATREEIRAIKNWFKGELIWLMIVVFLICSWPGSWLDRWTDKAWDSIRYNADYSNITIDKRPSDCDFFRAPIGDKGCKYEKETSVFGLKDRRALMKTAVTQEELKKYEEMPNSVEITWGKKED